MEGGGAAPVQESAVRSLDALPGLPGQVRDVRLAPGWTTDGDFEVSKADDHLPLWDVCRRGPLHREESRLNSCWHRAGGPRRLLGLRSGAGGPLSGGLSPHDPVAASPRLSPWGPDTAAGFVLIRLAQRVVTRAAAGSSWKDGRAANGAPPRGPSAPPMPHREEGGIGYRARKSWLVLRIPPVAKDAGGGRVVRRLGGQQWPR